MKDIVLIGAGGHCKSCIDVIEKESKYNILAILDRDDASDINILNRKVKGGDERIKDYISSSDFLITVGQIRSSGIRIKLYNLIKEMGGHFATVISSSASVSSYSKIKQGTIVMHNSVINADSKIGENCIINTLSNIEHDVVVGDHCHVSTGAMINGGSVIGNNCFVGSGAVIAQNVHITAGTVIGAGAVVIKSISRPGVYFGNPAKFFEEI